MGWGGASNSQYMCHNISQLVWGVTAAPVCRCRVDGVQRGAQRRRFKALRRYLLRGGKCEASAIQPSTNSRSWESRSFTPAALHDWQWLPRNTSSHNCKRQAKTRGFRRVRALERTSRARRLMRTRLSVYAAKRLRVFCVGQMQLLFVSLSCLMYCRCTCPQPLRAIRRGHSETSSEDWDKGRRGFVGPGRLLRRRWVLLTPSICVTTLVS